MTGNVLASRTILHPDPTARARLGGYSGKPEREQVELTDRLVRSDRAAMSSALLQIAGIGAGESRGTQCGSSGATRKPDGCVSCGWPPAASTSC
jgi:hypothetical protein